MEIFWVRGQCAKYRGLKTWVELGQELGMNLFYGCIGAIYEGHRMIIEDGVKLTFDKEPTVEQLKALNKEFAGYQRDYSVVPFKPGEIRDIEAEVDELKGRVIELEKTALAAKEAL